MLESGTCPEQSRVREGAVGDESRHLSGSTRSSIPRRGGVPGTHHAPPSPTQALPGSAHGETADIRSVRWAIWSPDLGAGEAEVVLPLRGGACRGPCQTLVYRTPTSGRSSRQVRARFCAAKYTGTLPVLGRACR